MESYIWLQTCDGSIQQVEEEVALLIPKVYREVFENSMGSTKKYAISLPQRVNTNTLRLVLDYCRFHLVSGRSDKQPKSFDDKFIRIDSESLCELAAAADSLQLRPLVHRTCLEFARMIQGKTPEEIREKFHIPDDLTKEEKLEALKGDIADDPRIRMLNRIYDRKRNALKENKKLHKIADEVIEQQQVDERSIEDLLSFINDDSKAVKAPKRKKRNPRKRKDELKNSCRTNGKDNKKTDATLPNAEISISSSQTSELQDLVDDLTRNVDFDFDDIEENDELDPVMKEEIDREVEEFARRLNLDWPERMQEILSLGQEGTRAPTSQNGNGYYPALVV
ncbi:SKP1-like protein 21 [Papaver somniferum]|uniref:SKP1-like protein 21 n=1 Tax=Papaver somniferum TaxID=3469 RepID=UPI000E704D7D|nr:SKP1-like protein 21 [Papaver somniferum]